MSTTEANSPSASARCPLCDALLDPANPTSCPKCDWIMKPQTSHHAGGSTRDRIAVCLSVVPGLGHIYKGHRLSGALYLLGAVFAVLACSVAATFTAGFGLLLLPFYWIGVMLQVFWVEDRAAGSVPLKP